jgi:hypothetical protein
LDFLLFPFESICGTVLPTFRVGLPLT